MFFFFLFSGSSIYNRLLDVSSSKTVYCDCSIRGNHISCNNQTYPFSIEHVVPRSYFTRTLKSTGSPINNNEEPYFQFKNDLHNQILEPHFINYARTNLPFGEFENPFLKSKKFLHSCNLILQHDRVILPDNWKRGFIARIFLYVQNTYGHNILTEQELEMYSKWNEQYPPLSQECSRNERILQIQGNDNPFITSSCKQQDKIDVFIYTDMPLFQHEFKYFYAVTQKNDMRTYFFKVPTQSSAHFYELVSKHEKVNCKISPLGYYVYKGVQYFLNHETIIECSSSHPQEEFSLLIEAIYKSRT